MTLKCVRLSDEGYGARLAGCPFTDDPVAREARIQAHIERIRSNPLWQPEVQQGEDRAAEIRRRYLAHWQRIRGKRHGAKCVCPMCEAWNVFAEGGECCCI